MAAHRPPHRRSTPKSPVAGRPVERAELVWQRALDIAVGREPRDQSDRAVELLQTALNDPSTMAHALSLGRTHVRRNADDVVARAGVTILDAAIGFLGAKPHDSETEIGV
jgi:hypothetical protein